MKVVMIPERQLVGMADLDRQYIEVIELIRGACCRCVKDSLAVRRNMGLRTVERLFFEDLLAASHRVALDGNSPQVAGPKSHLPIRWDEQLTPIAEPGRLNVNIPLAEILPAPAKAVLARERHGFAGPIPSVNRANEEMEITRSFCGYVS